MYFHGMIRSIRELQVFQPWYSFADTKSTLDSLQGLQAVKTYVFSNGTVDEYSFLVTARLLLSYRYRSGKISGEQLVYSSNSLISLDGEGRSWGRDCWNNVR